MRALLLVLVIVAGASCSVTHKVEVFPHGAPKIWVCVDGLPVRVIQDVRCLDGICGYTCEPGRWQGGREQP